MDEVAQYYEEIERGPSILNNNSKPYLKAETQNLINQSLERCKHYGDATTKSTNSYKQKKQGISDRRKQNRELIELSDYFMKAIISVSDEMEFLIGLVDADGYILSILGDTKLQASLRNNHFYVGGRWREDEIGTSAITVSMMTRKPIRIKGEQHYNIDLFNFDCFAAPIVVNDNLIGCICIASEMEKLYSNCLGTVIAIGEAISNQIRYKKTLAELHFTNLCSEEIISSIDRGFIIIDHYGIITHMNEIGAKIFKIDRSQSIGKNITEIVNSYPVILEVVKTGIGWVDREFFIENKKGEQIKLIKTAIPIKDSNGDVSYVIETFKEMSLVHKYATSVIGARARFNFENIIGSSTAIKESIKLAKIAAKSDSTVLITGETGTGKELIAQSIHNASLRSQGPYLAINCSAIPKDLMESELFGYMEGAFSGASKSGRTGKFELASGGTLLLDEIGDLPLDMQAKLLRVLQEKSIMRLSGNKVIPIDVRIIAATNKKLLDEVTNGQFRADLFYRINILTVNLPSLCERAEDIQHLCDCFIQKIGSRLGKKIDRIVPKAMELLLKYNWPGNIRELENVIERAINISEYSDIEVEHLSKRIINFNNNEIPKVIKKDQIINNTSINYSQTIEEMEYHMLSEVLNKTKWNITHVSKQLGLSRPTIYEKIKKYGIKKH